MSESDELKMYHIICDISSFCRDYFYGRKHLPRDFYNLEDGIRSIILSADELKKEFKNYGSKNK